MNAIIKSAFDGFVAVVPRERDAPVAPFGYGRDMACTSDVRPDMGDVDPSSTRAIGEALVRRIDCPRGVLPDDPGYGMDVRGALNVGIRRDEVVSWEGRIRTEWLKDDRVADALVTATLSPSGTELEVKGVVTPVDITLGTFSLTTSATSGAVLLQEIARA